MKDIPDYDAIVAHSEQFDTVSGYYPGMRPGGHGDAQAPDGPFVPLSPLLFDIDHNPLPAYILKALRNAEVEGESLDDALIEELRSLGYSDAEIEALSASSSEASEDKPQEGKVDVHDKDKPAQERDAFTPTQGKRKGGEPGI